MTTQKQSKWSRFFSLKTSATLDREATREDLRQRTLKTPHGIRSFIGDKQKVVDEMRDQTEEFITDIENHFGDATKYLTPAYTGRSKFENIETGRNRRIAVQWVDQSYMFESATATTVSFVYTETETGVRVDYILRRVSGPKKVVNDNYKPDNYKPDNDDIYQTQYDSVDGFRSVRRYESHVAFAHSNDTPPQWFIDSLSHRKPVTQ